MRRCQIKVLFNRKIQQCPSLQAYFSIAEAIAKLLKTSDNNPPRLLATSCIFFALVSPDGSSEKARCFFELTKT